MNHRFFLFCMAGCFMSGCLAVASPSNAAESTQHAAPQASYALPAAGGSAAPRQSYVPKAPLVSNPVWEHYSLRPRMQNSAPAIQITTPMPAPVSPKPKKVYKQTKKRKATAVASVPRKKQEAAPVASSGIAPVIKRDPVQEALAASAAAMKQAQAKPAAETKMTSAAHETTDNVSASWIIRKDQHSDASVASHAAKASEASVSASWVMHRENSPQAEPEHTVPALSTNPQANQTAPAATTSTPATKPAPAPVASAPAEQIESPFVTN